MKILFIGSSGSLSLIPLRALIKSRHHVFAFAFDLDDSEFSIIKPGSIQSLAFEHSIPFIKLNKDFDNAATQIQSCQPDIILVSCYARLLPETILSLANKGCFNVHPSLLPAFRGPDPIFWQFQQGVSHFGVTVHRISKSFDSGNIVAQQSVKIKDNCRWNKATDLLANIAAELVLNLLDDIEYNCVTEVKQDESKASYQPFPVHKDYEISIKWTAKRIYNFICAYQNDNVYFICKINNKEVKLIKALSYQSYAYDEIHDEKVIRQGNNIKFACHKGFIECQVKED